MLINSASKRRLSWKSVATLHSILSEGPTQNLRSSQYEDCIKKNHNSTSVTVFEVKLDSIDFVWLKTVESLSNHSRQWLLEKIKIDDINYPVFSSPDSHFKYFKVYSWWYLSSSSWLHTGARVVHYRKEIC